MSFAIATSGDVLTPCGVHIPSVARHHWFGSFRVGGNQRLDSGMSQDGPPGGALAHPLNRFERRKDPNERCRATDGMGTPYGVTTSPEVSMAKDIQSDVGKRDERTRASQGEARPKDPPRWRDDKARRPAGVDLLLRAAPCPRPPTQDDRIKLSMRVKATLRRPTGGTVNDAARPAEQRSDGSPLD